jgi:hypothetical protein
MDPLFGNKAAPSLAPNIAGADERKTRGIIKLTPAQERTLLWTKGGFGCCLLVVAIAATIVAAVWTSFSLTLSSITTFRSGPIGSDGFPTFVLSLLGNVNQTVVVIVAAYFTWIAYWLMAALNGPEARQLELGVDPYFWFVLLFTFVPLFLAVAFTSGIGDWAALTLFVTLGYAQVVVLYDGDLLNSYAYREAVIASGRGTWAWSFIVKYIILYIVELIVVLIELFNTYTGANGAPGIVVIFPVIVLVLQLYFPLVLILHYYRARMFTSMYTRQLWLYIGNAVYVTLAVLVAMLVFFFR